MLNGKPYTNSPEPYPGSSPIDAAGNLTDCYTVLKRLTAFTNTEAEEFIHAKYNADLVIGFYTPYNYAYVYSKYGNLKTEYYSDKIKLPIGVNEFIQDIMIGFIQNNVDYNCIDIRRASEENLAGIHVMLVMTREIMDSETQEKLIRYVEGGGKLIILPQVPNKNLKFDTATQLKDAFFNQDESSWREINDKVTGNKLAVKKNFEKGEVVYLDYYVTDAAIYKKIIDEMKITSRYAYSEDENIEVISLTNAESKAIYLFINNRCDKDKKVTVNYLEVFENRIYKKLEIDCGKKSVSILKVVDGKIKAYSVNGPQGKYEDSY